VGAGYPTDTGRVIEVKQLSSGLLCGVGAMRDALSDHQRALVYFGFRFDDVPRDFDDKVLDVLRELGSIVAERRFGKFGRAAIVDLRLPPDKPAGLSGQESGARDAPTRSEGCVAVQFAERW